MKKRRRIEITAFRRTVSITAGGPAGEAQRPQGMQDIDSRPCSADDPPAQLNQADLVEAVLSTIGAGPSPELEHLIEALIASNGDSARAAEQTGLEPNKIHSMLRSLGVPITRLRELLDDLRNRRGPKAAKKSHRD